MQYKKLKSDKSHKDPITDNENFITINMINSNTRKKTGNRRIISIFYNGHSVFRDNNRYRGYKYVEWFILK